MSVALLVSGYLLITSSNENAINRELERASVQYKFDRFTLQASIIADSEIIYLFSVVNDLEETADSIEFQALISRLSRLSQDLSGETAFFNDSGLLLYSQMPSDIDFSILDEIASEFHIHNIQTVNEISYIIVGGLLMQGDITMYFFVATDISDVVAQREGMMQSFVRVYFITLLLSMLVILALSAFITRPIKRMNNAAAAIAEGNYDKRLPVSGGDEIGQLSTNFNIMADAVENTIHELEESARRREDFVANFAHELKTPLTSVIGYADMLYQKTLSDEQIKDAAWYILSEGLRLEALSLKLMDLIVLGRNDFTLEEVSTEDLFFNLEGSLKPLLEESSVNLKLNIQPSYVLIEYDLLKTLLLNLIDNSVKAGCDAIEITGKSTDKSYALRIFDNGKGIPTPELDRITEAFYMVDKSRSYKQRSAGLGLALSQKIAEIHGGKLIFGSVEGVGTVVEIDLKRSGV